MQELYVTELPQIAKEYYGKDAQWVGFFWLASISYGSLNSSSMRLVSTALKQVEDS